MVAERTVYVWNRWQDPSLGIFISEDPIRDGSNWYAYAGGNPINFVDPMGLLIEDSYDAFRAAMLSGNANATGNVAIERDNIVGLESHSDVNGIVKDATNPIMPVFRPYYSKETIRYMNNKFRTENKSKVADFLYQIVGQKIADRIRRYAERMSRHNPDVNSRVRDGDSSGILPEDGPCYARALMGIAETYARRTLSPEEVKTLIKQFDDDGNLDIDDDYEVKGPRTIIKQTLAELGVDISHIEVVLTRPDVDSQATMEKIKKNATASLINVDTIEHPEIPRHWEEGDGSGNLVFDPISGSSNGGRPKFPDNTRYIQTIDKL